jgi:hypothetical protein
MTAHGTFETVTIKVFLSGRQLKWVNLRPKQQIIYAQYIIYIFFGVIHTKTEMQ